MKYLLGLLIIFEIADGIVSYFLFSNNIAREANPFLAPLVGDVGFIIVKVVGVLLCAVILWDIYKRYRRLALVSTSFFVVVYVVIVLWNLSLFIRA